MKQALSVLAVLLWTVSGTLLVVALADDHSFRLSQVALFLQLAACMPTLYLIADHVVDHHRQVMLQQLSEVVGRADAERAIRRLREVSH